MAHETSCRAAGLGAVGFCIVDQQLLYLTSTSDATPYQWWVRLSQAMASRTEQCVLSAGVLLRALPLLVGLRRLVCCGRVPIDLACCEAAAAGCHRAGWGWWLAVMLATVHSRL